MSDTVATPEKTIPIWKLTPPVKPSIITEVSKQFAVPPVIAGVLYNRGLHRNNADLQPRHELTKIPTLHDAAARVCTAIERGETILIHGDYDADGITGASILQIGLTRLGAQTRTYIPDRFENGYGINSKFIPQHAQGTDLFITVDCGITNVDEVEQLHEAGVDVIITDHHTPKEQLPDTLVVHPNLNPNTPADGPQLTGAGVAYHLLWAVHERLGLNEPTELIELATIGTVADVVPLLGENRTIVTQGLNTLLNSQLPGVQALCEVALGQGKKAITARDVAFMIAPRINASGRLGKAGVALDLLTTDDPTEARNLAEQLNKWNEQRRDLQNQMYAEALPMVNASEPAIVLDKDDWHPGIIGIVASKLVETYWKPVYISAQGKGSVRSIPGVNALGGLEYAKEALVGYGGHAQAAGFTIEPANRKRFKELINEYAAQFPPSQPEVQIEGLLTTSEVTPELWDAICKLEPFGEGIPAPTFGMTGPLTKFRTVGKDGQHLQLHIENLKGVSFNNGEAAQKLRRDGLVSVACSLQENQWQGRTNIEFTASHVRNHEPLTYAMANGEATRIMRGPGHNGQLITSLPVDTDNPTNATKELHEAIDEGQPLRFHLNERALEEAEKAARALPGLPELRATYSFIRAGRPIPLPEATVAFCKQVLQEVGLLDDKGQVTGRKGQHPYKSETFQRALAEQYRILELIKAYQAVDDASFEHAVLTLYT